LTEEKRNNEVDEVILEGGGQGSDSVTLSVDVISMLAGMAASEVEGIAWMSGNIVDGIAEKLGREEYSRGIKVDMEKERVILDMYLVVEYGFKIKKVTDELRSTVRERIEETIGLEEVTVNIHVQGINFKPGQNKGGPRKEEPVKKKAPEKPGEQEEMESSGNGTRREVQGYREEVKGYKEDISRQVRQKEPQKGEEQKKQEWPESSSRREVQGYRDEVKGYKEEHGRSGNEKSRFNKIEI